MRGREREAAFTLIELLVGMALLAVLLLVLGQTFGSTARGTGMLNTQGNLQQEALNGQALVAARLKEAWYVYPAGSTLAFTNNALIRNPSTGTSTFTVGTQPILAVILPPQVRGATCTPNTTSNTGCWRFYAYYGMLRSDWVAATTGFKDPGAAPSGAPITWVIAEYRADYASPPVVSSTPPAIPATASDNSGLNLLAEDVAPAAGGTSGYQLFTLSTTTTTSTAQLSGWPTPYVNRVQLDLRVTGVSQGKTVTLPNATSTYALFIYPENLGQDGV